MSAPAGQGQSFATGSLSGLIGLGGAEFRLPLLVGVFRFGTLEAVILNKAVSLVVGAALLFRGGTVSSVVLDVARNPLAVNLAGACWMSSRWSRRSRLLGMRVEKGTRC